MPKEVQKRGRRMKRKAEDVPEDSRPAASSKRLKEVEEVPEEAAMPSFDAHEDEDIHMSAAYPAAAAEKVFFGMLDDDEQEYFKRADEMLELDQFGDAEERQLFLESVYREAEGKELKIAHSQSCSRLLERLIRISTASQLKNLFRKFSGNFMHMLSHRFASHCCETLFTYAAPLVSQELTSSKSKDGTSQRDVNDVHVSLENLFLYTLAELEGNIGFLLTDRYASHALRVLLLVLSGEPVTTEATKSLLHSKRKEGIFSGGPVKSTEEPTQEKRPVPKAFAAALEKLIRDSVAGLDTASLRALATHPSANPTLQLLLTIELTHYGKQRAKDTKSIIRTLLPDDPFTADCESAGFISGLVYDSIGAHLVERIIEHAPAKLFKSLYSNFFKERLASHAKNEVATYVVCRILCRLGHDDLLEAHEILLPVIPTLLNRHWTSLTRALIERCNVREIDTHPLATTIQETYSGSHGFDVAKMLHLDYKPSSTTAEPKTAINGEEAYLSRPGGPSKVHFNILAQAMLIIPGPLSAMILDAVIALESSTLLTMAQDHIVSRTLQSACTSKHASMIQRRKFVQRFYGNFGEMSLDKSASRVVDCIWEGTHGLAFIRERIAEELFENETALRNTPSGRAVWKNWKMDLYKRRRGEWVTQCRNKAGNDGFQSFSELDEAVPSSSSQKGSGGGGGGGSGSSAGGVAIVAGKKTPLQIARERHAAAKAKKARGEDKRGRTMVRDNDNSAAAAAAATGANATGSNRTRAIT